MWTFNRNFNEKLHECHLFNTFFFIYLFNRSVRYTTYAASLHKQYFGVHLSNLSDLKACVLIIVTSVLHFFLKAPTGLCVHLSHRFRPDSRHGVQSVSVEIRDFLDRTQWPDTHKAYAFHVPPVVWPLQTPVRWAHAVLGSVEFADDVRRTLLNGWRKTQLSCGEHLLNVVHFMLWTTPICCGCMLWTSFYILWVTCCGWHVVQDTYMLWIYVVDIILYTVGFMLWMTCCGQHALCCGEHVVHNMYPTT